MAGMEKVETEKPLTIAACDNGMIYNAEKFDMLMQNNEIDIIVWAARGYPGAMRNPEMYGWIDIDENDMIKKISVKKPLKNPKNDPIVIGAFTFKRAEYFVRATNRMKSREGRVNGEYYIDTAVNDAIALGLKCKIFQIDYYICWGTPNDLRTFEYWQSCFDKWDSHYYNIKNDLNFNR